MHRRRLPPRANAQALAAFLAAGLLALCLSCDRDTPRATGVPATRPTGTTTTTTTVASLVPAATDLLLAMGARDRLVAVSNWDPARPETAGLPRVGDYRTIDWEKLAELRPAVMIVQFGPDKMPAGLEQRARESGMRLVNVRINRLDDVFATLDVLGDAVGEPQRAADAKGRLKGQLDAVRARVADRPPVRTLVSRSENPLQTVGGGNFLDDLLRIAGGQNVLTGPQYSDNSYPTIDREMLLGLNPDVVLNLLPGASEQVVGQVRAFWQATPDVTAMRAGRVHYFTEGAFLLPGFSVGETAARFARALHPEAYADAPAVRRPTPKGAP